MIFVPEGESVPVFITRATVAIASALVLIGSLLVGHMSAAFAASGGTLRATLAPDSSAKTQASSAVGAAEFTLDRQTRELRWQITFSGLSSDAVSAHIHTTSGPGVTSGVTIDLAASGVSNPLVGSATLNDLQIDDLVSGKDYVDIHTKLNLNGEIRGDIRQ